MQKLTGNRNSDRLQYLEQSISITGLGSQKFTLAIAQLRELERIMKDMLHSTEMGEFPIHTFMDFPSIRPANRYFSGLHHNPLHPIPLSSDIDPLGLLKLINNDQLKHTEDNQVLYHQLNYNDSDESTS